VKFFRDFERTGQGFAERVGDPDEFHDAMGRIALNFSDLDNTASIHRDGGGGVGDRSDDLRACRLGE